MHANQHEEHLAHSAPCSSRWDGFDRGDDNNAEDKDQGTRVIGRMNSNRGKVVVLELWDGDWTGYELRIGGVLVFSTGDRNQALVAGRWWVKNFPAPSHDDLLFAAERLRQYDDGADTATLRRVADWLTHEAVERNNAATARERGVSVSGLLEF